MRPTKAQLRVLEVLRDEGPMPLVSIAETYHGGKHPFVSTRTVSLILRHMDEDLWRMRPTDCGDETLYFLTAAGRAALGAK